MYAGHMMPFSMLMLIFCRRVKVKGNQVNVFLDGWMLEVYIGFVCTKDDGIMMGSGNVCFVF